MGLGPATYRDQPLWVIRQMLTPLTEASTGETVDEFRERIYEEMAAMDPSEDRGQLDPSILAMFPTGG